MPGPPLRGEPQLRLVQDLAVAPGAGDGVDRRGIEADDDQRFRYAFTRKAQEPTFWPLTNQLTTCLPGIVEVILFT